MKLLKVVFLSLALCWGFAVCAQQMAPQPLTFYYDYTVRAGKEEEFMNLVKTVGAPVRDKLMADGVVIAWGIDVSLLRGPNTGTHLVWYAVADWSGVEKVQSAMEARLAALAAEDAKAAEEARKKGQKPGMSVAERSREVFDASKTRDYLTRDLMFVDGKVMPPAGSQPYNRFGFVKVRPEKGGAFRAAWEKYNKPVYDKLLADGVIYAYSLTVEEVKTDGDWTHFTWYAVKSMADFEKIRAAFAADRARRSPEERETINATFADARDPDASRTYVTHSIIFKIAGQK